MSLLMKSLLSVFTLMIGTGLVSQALAMPPSGYAYECTPSNASAPYDLQSVLIRKDSKTNALTAEICFKTAIAKLEYASELKYIENPSFPFPEWNSAGVNFVIVKNANTFTASEFKGNMMGNTDEFAFSASLDCKLIKAPATKNTILSRN